MIQEWIETAKELGRQIPEKKGRLMFAYLVNQEMCWLRKVNLFLAFPEVMQSLKIGLSKC